MGWRIVRSATTRLAVVVALLCGGAVASPAATPTERLVAAAPRDRDALAAARRLPLSFVANAGQSDRPAGFLAQGGGARFAFTGTHADISLMPVGTAGVARRLDLVLRFVGADPAVRIEAEDRAPGVVNYLLGADPAAWRIGLATYRQLRYRQLWPGVDLIFRGGEGSLKYQFELAPGVDPATVRLAYAGARTLRVAADGSLTIDAAAGSLTDTAPVSYQDVDGRRVPVTSRFLVDPARPATFGFAVGAHDRRRPLVIDPGLVYSTFVGAGLVDQSFGIAVDAAGSAYITGRADSPSFPTTPGAFATANAGANDAFVTKLDPSGASLVYSTYLGGSEFEQGLGIRIDSAGQAYVTGQSDSPIFPTTPGAFDPTFNGRTDAFLTKLDATGSRLLYSTYIGTPSVDFGEGLAVDELGQAAVVGLTDSASFPTTAAAYDRTFNGGVDAFVVKLTTAGTAALYSTYLGGALADIGAAVAMDAAGNAYVAGRTSSSDFPTSAGAYDRSYNGGTDAFATKLDSTGAALGYSTYLGGTVFDEADAVTVDASGAAYLTGGTSSPDYPVTPGAYDATQNGHFDAFVTKLDPSGSAPAYSTFLGGRDFDLGLGVTVDSAGEAYLAGVTASTDFPTTPEAYDRTFNGGSGDAFVTVLDATGTAVEYATYLGGAIDEQARGVALDGQRNVYVTGYTSSPGYPTTPGAYDTTVDHLDAFVTRLDVSPAPAGATTVTLSPSTAVNPVGTAHTVTATAAGPLGRPVAGVLILFTVTGSVVASGSCTTNAAGQCAFTYQGPELPGADVINGCADNDRSGDADATEPCGTATKAWVLPASTPCEALATNGGVIHAANGDRASLGGNARATGTDDVTGHQTYQDHGPAQPMTVRSVEVLALTCTDDRTVATVFGRAAVDGSGSFLFRIDLRDVAEPGAGRDRYRILLSSGYDSGDQLLDGGNIQIH